MLGLGLSRSGLAIVAIASKSHGDAPSVNGFVLHQRGMTQLRTTIATGSGLRVLRVMRWLLPLGLALVALLFEFGEHVNEGAGELQPGFLAELVLFALVGPVAVFVTLRWVERLVLAYQETAAELASVNRDLEVRIEDRTAHLSEATDQLRRANEELRQLGRLKSEFVSLVSHQLRAPLTNINGALEIVAQETDRLPDQTQQTLRILIHETERLSWFIRTILDVSRIEAGHLQLRLGPVAVGPLLAEVCAATLAVEPTQSYRLDVEDGLPPAWADETLLGEVVRNLIENAIGYSEHDSHIDISASLVASSIWISVTDHGEGVAAEEQDRIFRSFYRVSDEDSVKGSGLGLYFADRLVRTQGGSLRVESPVWPEPDAPGARFTCVVPLAEDVPDDAGPTDPTENDGA
jgi:signal transduction histidine kinase